MTFKIMYIFPKTQTLSRTFTNSKFQIKEIFFQF